jgi:hypothetical protein
VVILGFGGVLAEAVGDVVFALPPFVIWRLDSPRCGMICRKSM